MCTAQHELREPNEQSFGMFRVVQVAICLIEGLEVASERNFYEFEVWVKFRQGVEDRGATESPKYWLENDAK